MIIKENEVKDLRCDECDTKSFVFMLIDSARIDLCQIHAQELIRELTPLVEGR